MTKVGQLPDTGEQILSTLPWIGTVIVIGVIGYFAYRKIKK